jgi:replicative DNA helicase
VTEGEKDADALIRLGLVATTKANCSGDWSFHFAERYFADRDVIVIQDNDPAGSKKALNALKYLEEAGTESVKILPAFGTEKGYDISDWLRDGHGVADLEFLVDKTEFIKIPFEDLVLPVNPLQFIDVVPPVREWLLFGMIPKRSINICVGEGGVGKSNVSLLMIAAIATGNTYGPFIPSCGPCKVVLVNVEDDINDLHRRIYALNVMIGFTDEDKKLLSENLVILPGRGKVGALMKIDAARNPVETDHAKWLRKICLKYKPDLVVLDTKSRLYGLNENDNDHGAQWISMLEAVYPCAFSVLAHTGKANANKNGYASRGASSISDNARSGILLSRITKEDLELVKLDDPEQCFKMTLTKSNYSPESNRQWYFRKMDEGIPVMEHVEIVDTEQQKNDLILFFQSNDIPKRDIDRKYNTDEIKQFKTSFLNEHGVSPDDFYKMIKTLLNHKLLVVTEGKSNTGKKINIIKPFSINGLS